MMIRPDPELFDQFDENKKGIYDEIIIEMTAEEGDVFISETMMEFCARKTGTPAELDMYMRLADEAHDKYMFAVLFKNITGGCIWSCSNILDKTGVDSKSARDSILKNFMAKYKYIIDWLWDFVLYYKVWAPIKFVGSLLSTLLSKKKD